MKNKNTNLTELRCMKVVKSNELVQHSRFYLNMQEQKIILYLISKIKPKDLDFQEHVFDIAEFCRICGLDSDNGANYAYLKQTLKDLYDKSIWVMLPNGSETLISWLDDVTLRTNENELVIKINEKMKPYLLQLKKNFTQYELYYVLAMRSQYSIRLYEILKSYEFQSEKTFDIDNLKRKLSTEKYERFPDFQRYVLDIALREINELSDITVSYETIKDSRRFAKLKFIIELKTGTLERIQLYKNVEQKLKPASSKEKI
jgi:plasmid replication initiation protein